MIVFIDIVFSFISLMDAHCCGISTVLFTTLTSQSLHMTAQHTQAQLHIYKDERGAVGQSCDLRYSLSKQSTSSLIWHCGLVTTDRKDWTCALKGRLAILDASFLTDIRHIVRKEVIAFMYSDVLASHSNIKIPWEGCFLLLPTWQKVTEKCKTLLFKKHKPGSCSRRWDEPAVFGFNSGFLVSWGWFTSICCDVIDHHLG